MTQVTLAQSYLEKATKRLKVLDLLLAEKAYSDIVREAQEIVELALKGMLRAVGIDPPKWHDVGPLLIEHQGLFTKEVQGRVAELASLSKSLRKEREFSFYGDEDFIPTEEYDLKDAEQAADWAKTAVAAAAKTIPAKK